MSDLFNASGAYDPTPAKAIHNTLPKPQPGEVWARDNGDKVFVIGVTRNTVNFVLCFDTQRNEQIPFVCKDNVFYAYPDRLSCCAISSISHRIDVCDHDQFLESVRTIRKNIFGWMEEPVQTKTIHVTHYDMDSLIEYYSLNHNVACAVEDILEHQCFKSAIDRLQREINKYGG